MAHQVSVVGSFLGLTCCWRTTGSGNIGLVGLVLVMTLGRGCICWTCGGRGLDLMHYLLMGPGRRRLEQWHLGNIIMCRWNCDVYCVYLRTVASLVRKIMPCSFLSTRAMRCYGLLLRHGCSLVMALLEFNHQKLYYSILRVLLSNSFIFDILSLFETLKHLKKWRHQRESRETDMDAWNRSPS